ncbi:hypothetical protein COU37_01435 [Candidatus Micrarchaeota archaeon CG10_big_fil_rev_8_21_14_0_10_45_29]|nr:MAG: hypothetical protein COU37_01435 [Candidatus Micrarchaeota archaeon CG10_big_fil_rev_8_21_14_0_10_45_29]
MAYYINFGVIGCKYERDSCVFAKGRLFAGVAYMRERFAFLKFSFFEKGGFLGRQEYALKEIYENAEFVIYCCACFFAPLFIAHPQILLGAIVNAALVMAAFNLRGHKLLPVIILPSVGALAAGVIFGPLNGSLFLLMPIIWVGNSLLVLSVKRAGFSGLREKFSGIIFGIFLKCLFLFLAAYALVMLGALPAAVLGAMGILQLFTAVAGSFAAIILQHVKRRVACAG